VTDAQPPSGFSPDEVWSILTAARGLSSDLVLVGGQALAFWARYYSIEPPADLVPYVTLDVDFLGGAVDARTFAAGLPAARVYIASIDDHTPSSARVVSNNVLGKPLEVDFLHSLAGLSERDVRNSALSLDAARGASIRIMHPLHCLESRIVNLALLPHKRDRFGIAQARLAVAVLHAHLQAILEGKDGNRRALKMVERIGELALTEPGKRCFLQYQIDVLESIPVQSIASAQFKNRRWPQITGQVAAARTALRRLLDSANKRSRSR
jgi:hypothetical protein